MPTAVKPRRLTVTQRTAEATRVSADYLHFEDQKRAAAALAEAAAEAVQRDRAFAARVQTLYEDMALPPPLPRQPTGGTGGSKRAGAKVVKVASDVNLAPIKYIPGYEADSAAPPDPYLLLELYGPAQLPLAIGRYEKPDLQQAVKLVKERNPKTRPNGTSWQALVDYIVEYVGGSH
jgi:hypothetical protein